MKPEDLEPYERWQLSRFGNILPPVNIPNEGKFETDEEERRFSEWMQHEAEQQMLKAEEYYSSIKD